MHDKSELEKLVSEMMDAAGYIILVGIRTPGHSAIKDKEVPDQINWTYRRFHFGIEDALQLVHKAEQFVDDDTRKIKQGKE